MHALMSDPSIQQRTIEACQRGDPEAFHELFKLYKDRVYSIALSFFDGDDAAAADITQQVFLKLMTRVQQFENRSEFSTWLYRLVTNACLDRRRALKRFFHLDSADEIAVAGPRTSIEDRFIRTEIEASVQAAIATLRPKLRMAILLKYFDDLSYEEIAAALNCSKGTVASRLNRGHQLLARKLAHLRGGLGSGGQDV